MSIQIQPRTAKTRFAKKTKRQIASNNASFVEITTRIFKGKGTAGSQDRLRNRSLWHRRYKLTNAQLQVGSRQTHGVELTDDVIIIGRDGKRIPPPSYATLRIDQLPQFKKS